MRGSPDIAIAEDAGAPPVARHPQQSLMGETPKTALLRKTVAEVPSVVLKDTASHKVIVEGEQTVEGGHSLLKTKDKEQKTNNKRLNK